jgi:ADP-heptose:LPS heptosyltransferase
MKRIFIIRGGAIGDFILTLPAMKVLRDAHPHAEIEILGYKHIAELANKRFYANRVRSIEYAALASFFARGADLPSDLADYLAGFELVITYLYDPDLIFETNLRRCGVKNIVPGPAKIAEHSHAARQLAEPLAHLGLQLGDLSARLYPLPEDKRAAQEFLRELPRPIVAIHPGSGSERKNWPLENWEELGNELLSADSGFRSMIVVSGEADEKQTQRLNANWNNSRVRFATNRPLPELAAILGETTAFLGHDSGISHLAAAANATCVLLFGPTDPDVWAPIGENVRVIRAPDGDLSALKVETVHKCLIKMWEGP